ncbi:Flp pilus assembly protein TadD, contains TPR repeats [Tistlia consotensis]|uniref:Flp pilus assembly protein TadD, contains TPR repeats n=1 Tax=Tistlia consotensis USBA 355 TaxID=560819 RepID=A0A1Y6BBM6_9PROT|nr:tetratricopeptide repeat-containing sulfotransferase family protein [Tistlia consotensis]SME92477.1 Flp pilus assembly protein TadD, contains TPR repeats [Tistlia consotensis USBA 355]SNR28052.1 Flp pilus assembly protein TadD, contains TPR repeats [Tistlia consotensis]
MLERAVALHRAGRPAEALPLYRRLLQAAPRHPDCQHLYGLALHQAGRGREALPPLERAVALAGDNAAFWRSLVAVLRELGQQERALETLRRALRRLPEDPGLAALQGDLLAAGGDLAGAVGAWRRALEVGPPAAPLLANLGSALNALGRHDEALAAYDRALALDPDLPAALTGRGEALLRLGREAEALAPLGRALEREPGSLPALKALGQAREATGDVEAAVATFRQGLALAPHDAELQAALGQSLQRLGRFEAAREALERALALKPDHTDALTALLQGRALAPDAPEAGRLRSILADEARPLAERAGAGFALARALQRGAAHEAAFAAAAEANALAARARPHDAAGYAAYVEALLAAFPKALFERLAGSGDPDPRPVFVVGLPRSGTSLVEQILASHPAVYGAGELTALPALARALPARLAAAEPWPACAARLDAAALRGLAADYRAAWPAATSGAARVTDKLPANYHYLGLIALALPAARIVACRRDPRDVALSNYFQFFERGQTFSHDLGDLARQVLAHRRLMAHWQALLPPGAILEVDHEALVDDLEGGARRLVAHCGLDWDPACLAFHETERAVQTASLWQVRQPLDRGSVGRWRAYRRQLEPFVAALAAGGWELDD